MIKNLLLSSVVLLGIVISFESCTKQGNTVIPIVSGPTGSFIASANGVVSVYNNTSVKRVGSRLTIIGSDTIPGLNQEIEIATGASTPGQYLLSHGTSTTGNYAVYKSTPNT